MLVVTGSAVSTTEAVLGTDGGLRGRPHVQLRLDPFGPRAAPAFLPNLPAAQFVAAYAPCGGYPLHLRSWHDDRSVDRNLLELAFRPGGLLLADTVDILSEDLDWRSGYERVLAAIGTTTACDEGRSPAGPTSEAATPLYAIADTYLGFWLSVLRDDAELIEGGQGEAVLHRQRTPLDRHVSATFEQIAHDHAVRLVADGQLPADTIVGRWWQDETVEIDVLGLSGDRPVLVGEAKWESTPVGRREVAVLQRKAVHLPDAGVEPQLALWSRAGASPGPAAPGADLWTFTPADMF